AGDRSLLRRALARADRDVEPRVFADVDLFVARRSGGGHLAKRSDDPLRIDALEEDRRRLALGLVALEELHEEGDGLGHPLRHDLDDLAPETRAVLVDAAAEVKLVHRIRRAVHGLRGAVPADVGDVVLATRVRATA